MSSGKNKFFFEEDTEEISSGVTPQEQADVFGAALDGIGVSGFSDSMEPLEAITKRMEIKEIKNTLLHIEYGIVDKDYVLHITPIHPHRNFMDKTKMRRAIEETIILLNKVIPFDIKVEIHLPREDWEVKVLSFVARGGAEAWNLNTKDLDDLIELKLDQAITSICMTV